jgi:putative ABC transport system ATP-binding protein
MARSLFCFQDGSLALLGTELAGADERLLVHCRRRLGFIFQAHNLHESLTAIENVRMGLEVHGRTAMADWKRASAHLLEMLGLGERLHYLPGNLSGGQKQRVAVAALDKDSALNTVALLKRLGTERGTTTLMVTHDTKIMSLADRIITMEDGRIVDDRGTT